ncbi:MAG: MotA/TolQ/ExbB proton channel family protein [Gemmatimonadota bacterium]|nr:MotA/TolQ/ExbB proton channel family protein [Gemmatimonadota bacterium]MDQ8146738.1 MotA/TolQ/ExbB proton channel family protein [Gemmatimonadota bacterium]MDQ8149155.1 MotA/TolQ/ExbB proton channel family protein [Gemmatimonadota bacterium]MDQ8156835.1 MotA/TolQ/ExbB proton channel family protein [Gemmatimonadota bacterium]MDQ8176091.1 MotA/TolQ/ExbB proton channel family protein [Gemmatimonadota bacterium]
MIFAQLAAAVPNSPLELIRSATPVSQAVLGVLAVLSLVSWAVMFAKWRAFRWADRAGRDFLARFRGASSLEDAFALVSLEAAEPHARVLRRAAQFVEHTRTTGPLSAAQVEALRLVLDAEMTTERDRLGTYIPFLAMVGSVSPLLGLMGTVLGVISAFLGVARGGSGNLAAVAPGVAEALVATAFALAVAIPAFFGYNIFAARLNRFDGELDGFGAEIIALMAREGRL